MWYLRPVPLMTTTRQKRQQKSWPQTALHLDRANYGTSPPVQRRIKRQLPTLYKNAVGCCEYCPSIRRPVCVIQPSRERKKSGEQLRNLTHEKEGAQRGYKD
jgi:hypothetical protein